MNKFYEIRLTQADILNGKGFYHCSVETEKLMSLLPDENGKVLVYTKNNDDLTETNCIKESFFNLISKEYNFNIIGIIDENEIPKGCGILLKL
jgi:hypothetical protein